MGLAVVSGAHALIDICLFFQPISTYTGHILNPWTSAWYWSMAVRVRPSASTLESRV